MAFAFPELFLVVADLTLASVLSCFIYALACTCFASLTGFVIVYSSFRGAKKIKRKGRTFIILASSNSMGQMFLKILDKAGFGELAVCQTPEAPIQKKDSTSSIKGTQVPEAEVQTEMQTPSRSHLKGISGAVKKPSAITWEEEAEFGKPNDYERKQKNYHVTPAFLIALLCVPTKLLCHTLKKRGLQLVTTLHTALMKFQD